MKRTGFFAAVVGPSGAGKDTLMRAAASRRSDLVLARRVISRLATAGGEDFDSVTPDEFDRRRAAGSFVLDWQAHGLSYGIPRTVEHHLANGRSVLANLSRGVIGTARLQFQPILVLLVTAPAHVLAGRLAARGREERADIERRLGRVDADLPGGPDVRVIENTGSLEGAVEAFLAALPHPVNE